MKGLEHASLVPSAASRGAKSLMDFLSTPKDEKEAVLEHQDSLISLDFDAEDSPTEQSRLLSRSSVNSNSGRAAGLVSLFEKEPEYQIPILTDTSPQPLQQKQQRKQFKVSTFLGSLQSTLIGSVVFLLYHVVFCLAQASTLRRPHASPETFFLGPLAKVSALGILLAAPTFIWRLGRDVPALYPTSDLFLAPFLADLALTIDACLYEDGLADDTTVFLVTFSFTSGAGLLLGGALCILAARVKLANLGAFLPFSVLCGFFTAIGLLLWRLAFSVDTGGQSLGRVLRSGDVSLMWQCLLHHAPSFAIGSLMYIVGGGYPFAVMILEVLTILGSYLLLWVTGTSLKQAQELEWFWTADDLVNPENPGLGFKSWQPPAPFGVWASLDKIHWKSVQKGLPMVCALAFLYLIRCSLHSAALKKVIPLVTRKPVDPSTVKKRPPVTLQKILEQGYGYSQIVAGLSGGVAVAPAVGSSLTLFKLGAEGVAPQYGSVVMLLAFYLTDFQPVQYIPKPAFSCLLIMAFYDLIVTWLIQSYKKTKQKWEWMVTPLIIALMFVVGLLNALLLGVAISTFIFVASFYRSGVVKYLANGLVVRSTIERGHRESTWLDENGDLIQIVVLQNYLFFGNAQSVLSYISTMFEDTPDDKDIEREITLPPHPLHLIIDLTIVTGADTSALDILGEIMTLCHDHQCQVFLCGLSHNLRSDLVFAGLKPGASFTFQPDLESALGKAEDVLLRDIYHMMEKEENDANTRQVARRISNADDGFRYALTKIDEQHHINYASELLDLEVFTKVVELSPGESLFKEEGGNVGELDRGFFFIEHGIMRIEPRPREGLSRRTPLPVPYVSRPGASIGHLNARTPTLGREGARLKQVRRADRLEQNFRLARIGVGWVVGTIEGCSGLRNPGKHVAVTNCRLHLLPYVRVKQLEKEKPALVLSLFRLVSHLTARRQELTIEQLAQLTTIMKSPAHSANINRMSLAALQT